MLECNKRPALFLSVDLASVGSWQRRCPQSFIKSCCVKEGFGCLRVWALGVPITTGPLHLWESENSWRPWGDHAMLGLGVFLLLVICQVCLRIMLFVMVISNAYVVVLWVGRGPRSEFSANFMCTHASDGRLCLLHHVSLFHVFRCKVDSLKRVLCRYNQSSCCCWMQRTRLLALWNWIENILNSSSVPEFPEYRIAVGILAV